MSAGEFDLIARYFSRPARRVPLGVGDDCALLALESGQQLAVSCDTLVEGRHFLSTVDPQRLGHKALAVNLSDLAACGARPVAFMLALSMPHVDEVFLEGFSRGLYALADEQAVDLVGGDTTAGPLAMTITAFGEVPAGRALLRSGARPGDDLWVSGTLGDARLALEAFRGRVRLDGGVFEAVRLAMECPVPRVSLGQALRDVASAAIDVSDGLLGDLAHVLRRSGAPDAPLGASLEAAAVPVSAHLAVQPWHLQLECALGGGDDYELCFTARPDRSDAVLAASSAAGVPVTRIGRIDAEPGVRIRGRNGELLDHAFTSFDHFRA